MSKIRFQRKYLAIPYVLFLIFFVVVPLLLIIYYALSGEDGSLSLKNFESFFTNKDKVGLLSISVIIGALNTLLCLIIGYPLAMFLVNKNYNKSKTIILLFIMPMWINSLRRTVPAHR